jgi:diguanylate cyclase (GGDEF)-like protein/PAS domain S-box-containing protein
VSPLSPLQVSKRLGAPLLWAVLGALLIGLGGYCLLQAGGLQHRLDQAYVGDRTAEAVREGLHAGSGRVLRPILRTLLQRESLRLRYLAVYDTEGVLLTQAGVYQTLRLPWLPEWISARLRESLYALTGSFGSRRIVGDDGRLLGSVEYRFGPGETGAVQVAALRHLRVAGWTALALALPMLLFPFVLWLRARRALPVWVNRVEPRVPARAVSDPPTGGAAAAFEEFRTRAGHVMDALAYAIIATDREGRVRYLNTTAERLTGWSLGDARGRPVYSVCHVLDSSGAPQSNAGERALQEGADVPSAAVMLRPRHGEPRPVEMMACLLRARDGSIDGATLVLRDNTRQAGELDALRREARLSQAVVDHLEEGLLMTDPAGVVRFANARAERMFGYSRQELEGFTVTKLMPVPFLNTPGVRITDYLVSRGNQRLPRVVGWRKDATTFPIELWVQQISNDDTHGLVVIARDISERLRGENLATRLGRVLDSATEEIYIFDAQTHAFLEVNRGARRNLDYRTEELARMSPLSISEGLDAETFQNYLARLRDGEQEHLVYRCLHKRRDGSTYPVEVRLNYSSDEEPPVFMAIAVDISERLVAEEKLQHLAHHDPLTGLPNRAMLFDRIEQARLAGQRGTRLVGVLFLDLDRFKQVNDLHGHEVGDRVLKAVAERLTASVRPSDTVARLAGDEFVVVASGLRSAEDAAFLAQKLLDRFAEPLDIPGLDLVVRLSIGITLYPLDDSDVEGLLRHADSAMYEAKQAGRGCYRQFNAEIDPEKRRRLDLEREIHSAVALNQFHLQVTPVLETRGGSVRALLSHLYWSHPRHGRIEHDELLRAAGRAGLLADLELWQICHACEHHLSARQRALPSPPFVVGISGWQLRDREFISHVLELLQRYQVPGDRLILSMTPDGMLDAAAMHVEAERLLARGIRFALRDFVSAPALDSAGLVSVLIAGDRLLLDAAAASDLVQRAQAGGAAVIAQGVASAATQARWQAAGWSLMAGAALQPSMEAGDAIRWLEGRTIDPL